MATTSELIVRRLGPIGLSLDDMPFDDTAAAQALNEPITQIRIRHGNIVDGFQVCYGETHTDLPHHGGNGGMITIFDLEPDDVLTGIRGLYGGWFGGYYVLQLTFETRAGKTYGPFGNLRYADPANPFALAGGNDESILAFFGGVSQGDNGNAHFLGMLGITCGRDFPRSTLI